MMREAGRVGFAAWALTLVRVDLRMPMQDRAGVFGLPVDRETFELRSNGQPGRLSPHMPSRASKSKVVVHLKNCTNPSPIQALHPYPGLYTQMYTGDHLSS